MAAAPDRALGTPVPTRSRIAWALYDWANSAYSAIIITFVFPAYFSERVAGDAVAGTALWGNTLGVAGVVVALSAPLLGAIADRGGRRKPWIAVFTGIAVLATAALWTVRPDPGDLTRAVLLVGIATVAAELAVVFYNAMLPGLAPRDRTGRWSGWAWGLGYAGGLACLLIALFGLVREDALLQLARDEAQPVRASFLLVALWYAVFTLPLLLLTPDAPARPVPWRRAVSEGVAQLRDSVRAVRRYADIARFLLARMLFIDGLGTLFAFGGVYASGTFGLGTEEVLLFGIGLNVTAGIGAALFAWVDDRVGSKRTIVWSLIGLILPGTALLLVQSTAWFWALGLLLGVFVGPVQAAGRSYLARAAPEALRTQMFGLFAFSGKATAFAGPLLVGWVTAWTDSQRAGMGVIIVLLTAGLLLMLTVPPTREFGRR